MELPNKHFDDFPIEFKEINPSDFKGEYSKDFDVEDKIIIEPDEQGYIYDSLKQNLELSKKNTVVVNAPVGSGKSYTIIKTIQQIYGIKNSMIIVATPFVSLVEQYADDIEKMTNIPKSDIYNYSHLGRHKTPSYNDKRVHVTTVNTLLGNPGEDSFKNSDAKRLYLLKIIDEAYSNNSPVFFIYDEIHDAIGNFKEEFIFHLWKWKNVIHKNIIISATYNEASKVVIKYLAELTDMKIRIIEAVRRRFPEKQSSLFLHYSADYNFKVTTDELVNVVDDLLARDRNIDILCYSKSLAKSILRDGEGIGKKLKDRFVKLNDCTSQLLSNQRMANEPPNNRFNNEMCNVGTNFKTGVNITKENHSYIIILPPRATRLLFKNMYGIFSDGVNNIIQALARQRTAGEIHIILPRPDAFDKDSLKRTTMTELQKDIFEQYYSEVKHYNPDEEKTVRYISLRSQEGLLERFYTKDLVGFLQNEIHLVSQSDRKGLPKLEYPEYESFKLNKGEQYLANTFKFFGLDLSAYVTYCAYTNQFTNCNLISINSKNTLFFEEGKIQKNLIEAFDKHFGKDYLNFQHQYSNFSMFYESLRNEFFNNFILKLKKKGSGDYINLKAYSDKSFETQLLVFSHRLYEGYNVKKQSKVDTDYSRSNYLLDSICISQGIDITNNDFSEQQRSRIQAFKNLGILRERLLKAVGESKRGEKYFYLPVNPPQDFILPSESKMLDETLNPLVNDDLLFQNDVFKFKRNIEGKDFDSKIKSLYKMLCEDFFELKEIKMYPQITLDGIKTRVKPIIQPIMLPSVTPINLLLISDVDPDYLRLIEESILENHKNVDDYYSEILNKLK